MTENNIWHSKDNKPTEEEWCYLQQTMCVMKATEFWREKGFNEPWCYLPDLLSLPQQLQAKEEEIKSLKEDNNFFIKAHAKSEENWEINYNKLYFMLQQAKEGLEFYANRKHLHSEELLDIKKDYSRECITRDNGLLFVIENGLKAQETLEIINKE